MTKLDELKANKNELLELLKDMKSRAVEFNRIDSYWVNLDIADAHVVAGFKLGQDSIPMPISTNFTLGRIDTKYEILEKIRNEILRFGNKRPKKKSISDANYNQWLALERVFKIVNTIDESLIKSKFIEQAKSDTANQIFDEIEKIEHEECITLMGINGVVQRRFDNLKKRWVK
jgi:hypothetical protein